MLLAAFRVASQRRILCPELLCTPFSKAFGSNALQSLKCENSLHHSGIDDIVHSFKENPFSAAQNVVDALTPAQRVVLAATLNENRKTASDPVSEAYIDELYRSVSCKDGSINEGKFRDIIITHSHSRLNDIPATVTPAKKDNFIMLTAGEEIDNVFGVRMGLSTLASAGLGNCVADVVGVTAAKAIEGGVKKLPIVKDQPKLSRTQKGLPAVQRAIFAGSSAGVVLGCFLGLVPLAASGNFFSS